MLAVPPRVTVKTRPLETARLSLAPIDSTDALDLWTAVESGRSSLERWLPWVSLVTDHDASKRYCEACAADWDGARACRLSIRLRGGGGRFLGVVGLETLIHLHRNADLGYWLRSDEAGQGYMREAALATIRWGFQEINAHRIRAAAATDNHSSLAVIRRLGFRFEGIARQAERCNDRWLDHATFALLASDFPDAGA